MFSSVLSAVIIGMEVRTISVEADVSNGMPVFHMVGFASSQVKEAQERVRTALRNTGITLPPKRMIVNLAPADIRKEGAGFDLPVAVAILAAIGVIRKENLKKILVMGEVSLDGSVNRVNGVLPVAVHGQQQGIRRMMIPWENRREAGLVGNIDYVCVKNLREVIDFFNDKGEVCSSVVQEENPSKSVYTIDLADVRGQKGAKRALEIAVSGFHNLLLVGPPGTGKSMLARRIPTILPDLTREEQLELTQIYSIAGLLTKEHPLIAERPFRAPHHTVSPQALSGGGKNPKPGEITLAHRGVLFLDEMPEFRRSSLEILRQPLEDKKICLSRVYGTFTFPANLLLVGAMNPCPCGFYPDRKRCSCSQQEINRYLHKISQPLLDRIDLSVEVAEIMGKELWEKDKAEETSETIRERVTEIQKIQQKRYKGKHYKFNGELPSKDIEQYCQIDHGGRGFLEYMFTRHRLSVRGYHKVLKVARTIADMEKSSVIREEHIQEAYGYRMFQKSTWER